MFERSVRWRFMLFFLFPCFLFCFWFHTWFYQMRWFYPYCSFKQSKWWRH